MEGLPGVAPSVMEISDSDRAWFEHTLLSVLPDLFGTALRLTRNPTDAEDLVAEATAKAWLNLRTLRERDRFRGWIFRILSNLYLSERRAVADKPLDEPPTRAGSSSRCSSACISRFSCGGATRSRNFLASWHARI